MENILTDQNFEEFVQKADKPVLVDFFARWCGPCAVLGPVLEKLAEQYKDKIIFAKTDIDDNSFLTAQKYGVDRIPMVAIFQKGKLVESSIGLKPEEEVKEWLTNYLEK